MRIKRMTLSGYRGYGNSTTIDFNDLTVFVGRNDVGKTTILEALDIFFNEGKGAVKLDKSDLTVGMGASEYSIEVVFSDLPDEVIVDATYKTTLEGEYLLNADGDLDVVKKYSSGNKLATYVRAKHPTNVNCADLLSKKNAELKSIIRREGIDCENQTTNAIMRKSVWDKYQDNLQLDLIEIDMNTGEDTKKIWTSLSSFLPMYSLFQSDRQNTDGDKEVQDPLKAAVAQFLKEEELQSVLNDVAAKVEQKLKEVADRTLTKLKEMDPEVANTLKPIIPSSSQLKWADVFKNVQISSDEDIPINKRGSGVKRLVLLNFFRAEAERRLEESNTSGLIYAIEEPETSQHFSNQKLLSEALVALSKTPNTQIIFTTHSGVIVKTLQFDDLRLVSVDENGDKHVSPVESRLLVYPSMNEVNYTAFGEVTEEYHDELYGYIEGNSWLNEFEENKPRIPYVRLKQDGTTKNESRVLSHYIRDVLHHPENTHNAKYTDEDLVRSVRDMRLFIQTKMRES